MKNNKNTIWFVIIALFVGLLIGYFLFGVILKGAITGEASAVLNLTQNNHLIDKSITVGTFTCVNTTTCAKGIKCTNQTSCGAGEACVKGNIDCSGSTIK